LFLAGLPTQTEKITEQFITNFRNSLKNSLIHNRPSNSQICILRGKSPKLAPLVRDSSARINSFLA
jgi:hypothetical protein